MRWPVQGHPAANHDNGCSLGKPIPRIYIDLRYVFRILQMRLALIRLKWLREEVLLRAAGGARVVSRERSAPGPG